MAISKTNISAAALVFASFIIGGFVFNAYQVGAFSGKHMFGFFRDKCDLSGLEEGSAEWQAKIDECKAERETAAEEQKTQMEEFKAMTPEERQAKIDEMKANMPESGEWKGRGSGPKTEHLFGFREFSWCGDDVSYEIINLDNGVQVTMTSDNTDVVKKIQSAWSRRNSALNE